MAGTKGSKQEQLLQTARTLFYKHGFKRVTIDEICRTADVSKMTFYKYFRDKPELIRALLSRLAEERLASFISIMTLDLPFAERMRRVVELRLRQADEVGRDFVRELYASPLAGVREFLQRVTQDMLGAAMGFYVQAQKDGAIRADVKPEFISWFLGHAIDMMGDGQLIAMYGSTRELAAEVINLFLYGILDRKE